MHRFAVTRIIWLFAGVTLACSSRGSAGSSGCGSEKAATQEMTPARDTSCSFSTDSAAVPSKTSLAAVCGCTTIDGDLFIDASAIADIRCLGGLQSIKGKLGISARSGASVLASLAGLEQLQQARAVTLTGLTVPDLTALTNLRDVDEFRITQCDNLSDLRGLRANIRALWLDKDAKLRSLEGFSGLTASQDSPASVRIESQPELESLDGLFRGDHPYLTRFQVIGLPKLTSIDLRSARELGALVVRSSTSLQEIRGVDSVEKIGQLHLTGLSKLARLPSFDALTSVVDLELIEMPLLRDLAQLSNLTSVEKMSLSFMDSLSSLHGLEKVSRAQRILIENLTGLETLAGLRGLQTVNTLWIHDDDKLKSLRGLRLDDAFELAVRFNDALQKLDGLETLRKVGTLDVSENPALTSVRALSGLREAEKIYARANGKLPQCELDRVMKQLPRGSTHEITGNGPTGSCSR